MSTYLEAPQLLKVSRSNTFGRVNFKLVLALFIRIQGDLVVITPEPKIGIRFIVLVGEVCASPSTCFLIPASSFVEILAGFVIGLQE